ncbi:MAG: DNA polymerase III subunit delta [Desulfobacterales bacterium]|nr:DNA polymerase III subunit delta [Desulfobacterales bacterium]
MPEINFNDVSKFLNSSDNNKFYQVTLIFGDNFLVKEAFDKVIEFIVTGSKKNLAYEVFEGQTTDVNDLIERLTTYSLFSTKKVIGLRDFDISTSRADEDKASKKSSKKDSSNILFEAIKSGFPKGTYLVITIDKIDKRKNIFKIIADTALLVNCLVSTGSNKKDKDKQEEILKNKMQEILKQAKKSAEKSVFDTLYEMIGFDLWTFSSSLEKLINYIGDKKTITSDDVHYIITKSKQDPIFELTNAVFSRDFDKAVSYLDALISEGFHPLAILSALMRQLRKLLLAKHFLNTQKDWSKSYPYYEFEKTFIPRVKNFDSQIIQKIEEWESHFPNEPEDSNNNGKADKRKTVTTESLLAKGGHPYAIYSMFQKADEFTTDELIYAIDVLTNVDKKLKSSSPDIYKLILENAIIKIIFPQSSYQENN